MKRDVSEIFGESGKLIVQFRGDFEDGTPGVFKGILSFNTLVVSGGVVGIIEVV